MLESIITNPLFGCLFVFLARVTDMSLDVLRLLMLTRGYALTAAVVDFLKCLFLRWPWDGCCTAG